jgi:hypothetical protein
MKVNITLYVGFLVDTLKKKLPSSSKKDFPKCLQEPWLQKLMLRHNLQH